MRQLNDISGQRFGKLVVLRHHSQDRQKNGAAFNRWECKCDCGNVFVARGEYIKYGNYCDRLCKKCITNIRKQKGLSVTTIGHIWRGIINRCENTKCRSFVRYGGRGIRICKRWRESIPAFAEGLGPRPSMQHTVDRRDNNGNYSCGQCDECSANGWVANCRWATPQEQILNSSHPRFIEHDGESLCLAEWARRIGISREAMRLRVNRRIKAGMPLSTAITMKLRQGRKKQQTI